MCELFFQYSREGSINLQVLRRLVTTAIEKASTRNSDGFGLYDRQGNIYKSGDEMDYEHMEDIEKIFQDSKYVVLHLRMATDGSVCKENSHPFQHESYRLSHNGVTTPPEEYEEDRADSYHLLRDIHRRDTGDTVQAIKDTMSETSGSVSIFLKNDKDQLYYFRKRKSFTFGYLPEVNEVVGATKERRLETAFSGVENLNFFEDAPMTKKDPEEGVIYKIDDNGIHHTGDFKLGRRYNTSNSSSKSSKGWRSNRRDSRRGRGKKKKSKSSRQYSYADGDYSEMVEEDEEESSGSDNSDVIFEEENYEDYKDREPEYPYDEPEDDEDSAMPNGGFDYEDWIEGMKEDPEWHVFEQNGKSYCVPMEDVEWDELDESKPVEAMTTEEVKETLEGLPKNSMDEVDRRLQTHRATTGLDRLFN